jgi:hypothetical protein
MHLRVILALFLALGLTSVAMSAPAITVGNANNITATSANQINTIQINYDAFNGGGTMSGQTLYVSVGDEGNGGDDPADAGEPFITAIDGLTGTPWASNNTGGSISQVVQQMWSFDVTSATGEVAATGLALSVTINRNGAPVGVPIGLRVFVGVPDLAGPYASNWSNSQSVGVAFLTQDNASGLNGVTGVADGSFTYVPEPSSVVLGLMAAAGLAVVAIRRRGSRG